MKCFRIFLYDYNLKMRTYCLKDTNEKDAFARAKKLFAKDTNGGECFMYRVYVN